MKGLRKAVGFAGRHPLSWIVYCLAAGTICGNVLTLAGWSL